MSKKIKKIMIVSFLFMLTMVLGIVKVNAEEYSETFSKIFSNGELDINSVPIHDDLEADSFLYTLLNKRLTDLGLGSYQYAINSCNADWTACDFNLYKYEGTKKSFDETHRVKFNYNSYDQAIYEKVKEYLKIAKEGATILDGASFPVKLYKLTDLNLINYYNSLTSTESLNDVNTTINYISSLKKEFNNSNFTYTMDVRAGNDIPFQNLVFGYFCVYYNNIAYGLVDPVGTQKVNVLYIPSDTANTKEAYISAAQKRIANYLNKDVNITVGGLRSEYDLSNYDPSYVIDWSKLGDESLMTDYYYNININGNNYEYIIIRNDKLMQTGEYESRDLETNISVKTNASIPSDTLIKVNQINSNEEIKNKLNKKDVYTVDISLNSNSTNKKITKLANGKFRVEIPIPNYLKGKVLIVDYITEDGKLEKHEVTIEGNYAVFETNHFSTYSLSEDVVSEVNPQTYDGILIYIGLGLLSIIGLCGLYILKYLKILV